MRLVLASVLFSFDLKLCEEAKDWANQKSYFFWKKGPLMVKLKAIS